MASKKRAFQFRFAEQNVRFGAILWESTRLARNSSRRPLEDSRKCDSPRHSAWNKSTQHSMVFDFLPHGGGTPPTFPGRDNIFFTVFFTGELTLRVAVEKERFILGRNKGWNSSFPESYCQANPTGHGSADGHCYDFNIPFVLMQN